MSHMLLFTLFSRLNLLLHILYIVRLYTDNCTIKVLFSLNVAIVSLSLFFIHTRNYKRSIHITMYLQRVAHLSVLHIIHYLIYIYGQIFPRHERFVQICTARKNNFLAYVTLYSITNDLRFAGHGECLPIYYVNKRYSHQQNRTV